MNLRNHTYIHPNTRPTKIVSAAILKDGKVWTGTRHADIIYGDLQKDLNEIPGEFVKVYQGEQGFMADNGMFLSRDQAAAVAIRAGQLARDFTKTLLSEHLW